MNNIWTRPVYTKDLEVMLGDPKRAVLVMTLPLILSYAISQINMFADTAWCAGLGSDASTALSTIIPYYWLISGIGTGIGIGAAASIARHLGRDESKEAESMVSQTIVLSLAIGISGQNARLAAKLTGCKIDIKPESGFYAPRSE